MNTISLSQITSRVAIRSIKQKGIDYLRDKILQIGYLPEKPLLVTGDGNEGYILLDGNHRLEALKALGIDTAPVLIDDTLVNDTLRLRRARQANEATEAIILTTFVDEAEFIWQQAEKGMTQSDIGSVMGWSREKVKNYIALQSICKKAWEIIGTTFEDNFLVQENEAVPINGTTVPFTEGLLRSILPLTSAQQLELVSKLANKEINKKQFNDKAQTYKTRNEIRAYVLDQLSAIPKEFIESRLTDIDQGGYDSDWQISDKPKLTRFIEAIKAEYEEKAGTKLILGDFNEEILKIEDNTVDLILTDIPYNISNQGKVTKQGGKIVNATFDSEETLWDTIDQNEYNNIFKNWTEQWYRVLVSGGNIIVWGDKPLVLDFWRIFQSTGIIPKSIIVWAKTNPNPAALARKGLISATEFMIWGTKSGAGYTFNSSPNWDRNNIIYAALCSGKERILNSRGETLHPTQKPLAVIEPLIEVFSNRGDLVLDGFAGTGATGKGAIKLGRKFIGIESNPEYYKAMEKWLNDT